MIIETFDSKQTYELGYKLELGEARGRIIDSAEACRELYKEYGL